MKPMVLVVEDDAEVAEITARMLEDAGYQSGWTKTDREAIAIVSNMQIAVSLLIIDLTLPDKPGFEVARLARQSRPSPPIVFTSGYPRYREVPPEFEGHSFWPNPIASTSWSPWCSGLCHRRPGGQDPLKPILRQAPSQTRPPPNKKGRGGR